MLSTDYEDKVIVTTIQKLGLALDPKNNCNYKERLEPLRNKRVGFIFDECHRSQFGENHNAIKSFFENAQLFGFIGTPIFEENATYKTIEGQSASYKTTTDVFQKELHSYTITNAIEDKNVLRFHIDYFNSNTRLDTTSLSHKMTVFDAILKKHDKATHYRRFNFVLATSSISDAIEYYHLFKQNQREFAEVYEDYRPLNIACVSPPAEGNKDIQQIQEDLPQEKADNAIEPNKKQEALTQIIKDYNTQYGTNHRINEFNGYYQDVQQCIKYQKFPNKDYPHKNKIDVMIVVDMLLTGFVSKYLNTLYVDKNLKYHGLIQAFSQTNRVINDTKPYGNIVDLRQQEESVDKAMVLFSGANVDNPRDIWVVDASPIVIIKYKEAVANLKGFMESKGLECTPSEVANLKGDEARSEFINYFKEVQRLKTHLNQYTDLEDTQADTIEALLPTDDFRSFKSNYLDTAKRLKAQQDKGGKDLPKVVEQLDFEFVLFSFAIIDYDYIIGLIAKYTQDKPSKHKMTPLQLINLFSFSANLMDEREVIIAYINSLEVGNGMTEKKIREGYQKFKDVKSAQELLSIAEKHNIESESLKTFFDKNMNRMLFDGEKLTDLLAPLELGWKDRRVAELALMEDLVPLLNKLAQGREITGLKACE